MFYKFNKESFEYVPVKNWLIFKLIGFVFISFLIGYFVGYQNTPIQKEIVINKHQVVPVGSQEWKDSVFTDYQERAAVYLNQERWKNSPIKPDMLVLAAYNAYDSSGVLLPVELALAQAQLESSMGMKGRSPDKNPYNVGEYDSGTVMWFETTFDGIQAYYYFMVRDYLKCKSINTLFKSFTNCNGKRYASNPEYEIKVSKQYDYIKRYIDNRINIEQ